MSKKGLNDSIDDLIDPDNKENKKAGGSKSRNRFKKGVNKILKTKKLAKSFKKKV